MKKLLLYAIFLLIYCHVSAQPTVGLLQHDAGDLDTGYILFAPMVNCSTTYMIDKCGRLVHSWLSDYSPQISNYLLDDGSLLRGGGANGVIDRIDWNGNSMFKYIIFDTTKVHHHDIKLLPNGNILAIVREIKSKQQALDAGRNPSFLATELYSEKIIEIRPVDKDTYDIVWEWRAWDHLVQRYDTNHPNYGLPKEHPELINLNYIWTKQPDIFHINAVDYNPEFDQILISVPMYSEVWIIDHSTTTAEAASHSGGKRDRGGDLLYRWGNSLAYGQGSSANKKLYGVHNAKWIEPGFPHEGSIILFSNGSGRNYSSVDIFTSAVDVNGNYDTTIPQLPLVQDWIYTDSVPASFFSASMSGEQMLMNGNILICDANKGTFFEVDSTGKTLWKYKNPISTKGPIEQGNDTNYQNSVFRCTFIPAEHKGLAGRKLVPGAPLELNPIPSDCHLDPEPVSTEMKNTLAPFIYQYPDQIGINLQVKDYNLKLVNLYGQQLYSGHNVKYISTTNLKSGLYLILIDTPDGLLYSNKIIIGN